MTTRTFTLTGPGKSFGSGTIKATTYADPGKGRIGLDVTTEGEGKPAAKVNLENADAREFAEWILANLPEPKREPTPFEEDWPQIPVGATYGFGDRGPCERKNGERGPYLKRSEQPHNGSPLSPYDHSRGLHWYVEPPKPTVAEQVAKLADGTTFERPPHFGGTKPYRYIKLPNGQFYSFQDKRTIVHTVQNWATDIAEITVLFP